MEKLTSFTINTTSLPVTYLSTQTVKTGVECDVYSFTDDTTKDLAIVHVEKGHKTPRQKVLSGEKTIEGYVGGSGKLTVISEAGETVDYEFGQHKENEAVVIKVGETMQWEATTSGLTFFESCTPPYEDGRFQNLD